MFIYPEPEVSCQSVALDLINRNTIVAGYRSTGFLAYVSADVAGNAAPHILFDTEVYDYGDNYNPATGIYTVPRNGTYLVQARVRGMNQRADHFIRVDGDSITYTNGNGNHQEQSSLTSITLHLVEGQEVTVDVNYSNTIDGSTGQMTTSFGASMLYGD